MVCMMLWARANLHLLFSLYRLLTLRHPPATFIFREYVSIPVPNSRSHPVQRLNLLLSLLAPSFSRAQRDMILPLSEPIHGVDGALMSEIPIPKDTVVLVGILGSNMNRRTWGDDAWEWKPERWLKPLPSTLEEARIPGVYANL